MSEEGKIRLQFTRCYKAFNPGEVASFPTDVANRILQAGYAKAALTSQETRAAQIKAAGIEVEEKSKEIGYPELRSLAKAKADLEGVELAEAAGGLSAEQLRAYLEE